MCVHTATLGHMLSAVPALLTAVREFRVATGEPFFQPRTALLAGTRSFSLRENGVYPYADLEF
jgi:hypothetical protein